MRVSVVIPSHGRPAKLAACVAALQNQVGHRAGHEILVGLDGPDATSVAAAKAAFDGPELTVTELPKAGANEVRSTLIEQSTGDLIITLNDDVVPRPGFIDAHRRAHKNAHAVVAGYSPYLTRANPTLLDEMVQRTGLVFFWPDMLAAEPGADLGYRCAATLNLSARKDDILSAGGFADSAGYYGHDDIELAFRMQSAPGLPVRFCAEAVADHDHRHTAEELLRRDAMLGASMWHYSGLNPAFAQDLCGHDPRDQDRLAYFAGYVASERRDAARSAQAFIEIARQPAAGESDRVLESIARQHTVARRWLWRSGLIAASNGRFDPAQALDALLEPAAAPERSAA